MREETNQNEWEPCLGWVGAGWADWVFVVWLARPWQLCAEPIAVQSRATDRLPALWVWRGVAAGG